MFIHLINFQTSGRFLLDQSCKESDLVGVAEALDALMDALSEDCTDATCAEIQLVPRLQSLVPVLQHKVCILKCLVGVLSCRLIWLYFFADSGPEKTNAGQHSHCENRQSKFSQIH
jgi:hypothetical protein